jgi:hypothetical protein
MWKKIVDLDCSFHNCTSIGDYGGAISVSFHLSVTEIEIKKSNFSENVAGTSNQGNDYADLSSEDIPSLHLYSLSSVSEIQSTSNSVRFYHVKTQISLDCLLVNECKLDVVYVSSTLGVDDMTCGISELYPCQSIEYSWVNRLTNGTIYILDGVHPIVEHRFNTTGNLNVALVGYKQNENSEDSLPVVYPMNDVDGWINISRSGEKNFTLSLLKVLYPSDVFHGTLFVVNDSDSYFTLEKCYLSSNSTNLISGIFNCFEANVIINSCVFHGLTLDLNVIFICLGNCCVSINNCTIYQMVLFNGSSRLVRFSGFLNLTNSMFYDITGPTSINSEGVLNLPSVQDNIYTDCTFKNVSSGRSCVLFNGTGSVTITEFVFRNITSTSSDLGGAAVAIINSSNLNTYNFISCSFTQCHLVNNVNGGAIFSKGSVIALNKSDFHNNTVSDGSGNDVFINASFSGMGFLENDYLFLLCALFLNRLPN